MKKFVFQNITISTLIILIIIARVSLSLKNRKCIPNPLKIKQCQSPFYNFTNYIPQAQSQSTMDMLNSLLDDTCSKDLRFLLCSIHVPFCDLESKMSMYPCRFVCDKVHLQCQPVLRAMNSSWPEKLNCSQFPLTNTTAIKCIDNNQERDVLPVIQLPTVNDDMKDDGDKMRKYNNGQCRHLRYGERYVFINRTGRCALKCSENDLFSRESKRFAELWMSIIATLTFVSTLFTCITFIFSERIKYPEQPIIFLTFSYNIYSLSILLRLFFSRIKVACDYDPVSGQYIVIQEGLENTYCAITFLLNFYFSTATHMWWIILTFSWMLFCFLNVSSFSLGKNSGIFHLFVWLMTSILTISVLILRSVDADELFGLCSVGEQVPDLLLTFSIIPKTVCLLIGLVFLALGFMFFRYRSHKSRKNNNMSYVTSIGFRLGLFSIIYIIAIITLISCEMYQYYNYHAWLNTPKTFRKRREPIVALFLLKLFMSQVVGINTAIWIWSLDAAGSWKKLFVVILDKVAYLKKHSMNSKSIDLMKNIDSTDPKKYLSRSEH